MITETDHMFMRPPKNVATEEKPVGFGFYYMISTDPKLLPVVKKFLKPEIDVHPVDAVGPSPLIIHKPMLEKVAEPWWKLSLEMKHDSAANTVFGWVLEMWGYNLAARNLGIRHTVLQDLQVTGCHCHYHCHLCHLTSSTSLPSAGRAAGDRHRRDGYQRYLPLHVWARATRRRPLVAIG